VGCSYSVIGIAGRSEFPALTRVAHHARTRTDWNRELLVRRDTSDGFNSAEAGWLEGRLADVLELAPAAKLTMGRRDRDESLPEYERDSLEQMIRPITAVMRAIDASPDTPDQGPPLRPPNKRKPGSPQGPSRGRAAEGWGKAPASFVSYNASSTVAADGKLALGGQTFNTPSGAAVAVLGRQRTAGRSGPSPPVTGASFRSTSFGADLASRSRRSSQTRHRHLLRRRSPVPRRRESRACGVPKSGSRPPRL
jgi:hypothetical protein